MKLHYFFGCILAAASMAVWPENGLAHGGGGGGGGGHGFGGPGGGHAFVGGGHEFGGFTAALVRDSGGRVHFLLVASLVAEITAALVTVVSVDAVATFAILLGTLSSSASMGSNIRLLPVRPTVSLEKKLISRPPE